MVMMVISSPSIQVTQFPVILLPFVCLTAYRVHSIFMLRMFNDGVAMTILYLAIICFISDQWTLGCAIYRSVMIHILNFLHHKSKIIFSINMLYSIFIFSLAVSVKMNVLLFSPGLAILLLRRFGLKGAIERIALCGMIQV